jgi:hypothetical protein
VFGASCYWFFAQLRKSYSREEGDIIGDRVDKLLGPEGWVSSRNIIYHQSPSRIEKTTTINAPVTSLEYI